jgi:uncharacterized protein DUF2637
MTWSELPTSLRTVLGAALLLVIAVAVASFYLSFLALREVAANPVTGWGPNAWVFPLCVDAALLASEVVLVGASMVRGVNRAVPFCFMLAFGGLTVWFNIERVPAPWRMVTAVPPLAGIFMTLLIAYLLKEVVLRALGRTLAYTAPPMQAGALGAPQTTVMRLPDGSYGVPVEAFSGYGAGTLPPQGAYGEMPSQSAQPSGQNGHDRGWKGEQTREYLATLGSGELAAMTRAQLATDMHTLGVPIDETYAGSILGKYRANGAVKERRR